MNAYPVTSCAASVAPGQAGMSLIEVLVAVVLLGVGLLGAAAVQLNALKYTDSSRMISQASFIAYDMLDRIRANAGADYAWENHGVAPAHASTASVRDVDLRDFEANVSGFAGKTAKGSIAVNQREVSIRISWDDARGTSVGEARETFVLASRIAVDPRPAQ
ncbi:type IV pilus modification protein PilV [Pseudomonas mucidolens]|nr:type IV pilus modification protein PilV [Pseudomonas mucidolens]